MKLFKILFLLCLLGTIVFGDLPLGGVLIVRYIAVFTLFVLCCTQKVSFPHQAVYIVYFVFIFFFFLTSVFTGYADDFFVVFLGAYFVSIVWIWATYILIKKYNSLEYLLKALFYIGIINAVITIGQYYRNPIAFGVSYLLNVVDDSVVTSMADHAVSGDTFGGFAMYGLFGAVPNGYYSAVFSVLSCIFLYKSKKFFLKAASMALWAFALFALFCTQERAALVGGLFFSGWYCLKILVSSNRGKTILVLSLFFSIFLLIDKGPDLFSFTEGTRFESFDLDSRTDIFSTSRDYILENPLTANLFEYIDKYKLFPHHIIYYSFMSGSLIGGMLILGAFVYILLLAFKLVTKKVKESNVFQILASFCLFAYSIPSLTHNDCIASGATLFWVLAAAVITTYEDSKRSVSLTHGPFNSPINISRIV